MTENNKTDKELLNRGIRIMFICLLLMFLGPTMIHIAFSNSEKPLYIPLLLLGILLSVGAIYSLFKGISTIMDSMFGKRKAK